MRIINEWNAGVQGPKAFCEENSGARLDRKNLERRFENTISRF
jgi:hypothetical protein